MTLRQLAKNRMYKIVLELLAASSSIFTGFTRAITEITNFTNLNGVLDGFIEEQAKQTTGVTGDKNVILTNLISITVKASRKALVYAKDQHDEALKATFDVHETTFSTKAQERALAKIENIHAALVPITAALAAYRITAADITAIGAAITAFEGAEGEPGVAIADREAGTEGIETAMNDIDDSLEILDDLIVHGLDEADANFINQYRNARRIIILGTRHTGIEATFNDAATSLGIEHATLTVKELNKTAASNILGVASIISMKPGMYHFIFDAKGYVSQTMILKIERGVTLEMTVKLAAVMVPA